MSLNPNSVLERLSSLKRVVIDIQVLCDLEHPLSLGPAMTRRGEFIYIPDEDADGDTMALNFRTGDGFTVRNLFRGVLGLPVLVFSADARNESIYRRRCEAMRVTELFCGVEDKNAFLQKYSQEHGLALREFLLFDKNLSPDNPSDYQLAASVGLLVGPAEFASNPQVPYVAIAPEPHGTVRGFSSRYLESTGPILAYYDQTREGKAQLTSEFLSGPRPIRALVLDIDGTCTDGCRIFSADGREWKRFCQKDLQALRQWVDSGKILCFLTGESNSVVVRWAEACGVDPKKNLIMEAAHLKVQHLLRLATQFRLKLGEIAYMGDDTNDLGVLELISEQNGFAACPKNAVPPILNIPGVHPLSSYGGSGACAELIVAAITGCQ
jgi:3-deoxy-D-manno-octulosonate 8-phosphate phosphatase (KDO 8-P phosphatase)